MRLVGKPAAEPSRLRQGARTGFSCLLRGALDELFVVYCLVMVSKAFGGVGMQVACGVLAAALTAPGAGASELALSLNNGRVTIRAQDALITEILTEWGRVGNTAIIDADELADQVVTIEFVDVPEAKALRTLLRAASGYMAVPRAVTSEGGSRFDRILILATSKPAPRIARVASPGRATASTPTASDALGQRLGVVPSVSPGRSAFTVSPAQQEQLNQLQRLLQRTDGTEAEPPQPGTAQPVFGNVPASRPMETTDPRQGTVGVPTGAFGSTTPVLETADTPTTTTIPRP